MLVLKDFYDWPKKIQNHLLSLRSSKKAQIICFEFFLIYITFWSCRKVVKSSENSFSKAHGSYIFSILVKV